MSNTTLVRHLCFNPGCSNTVLVPSNDTVALCKDCQQIYEIEYYYVSDYTYPDPFLIKKGTQHEEVQVLASHARAVISSEGASLNENAKEKETQTKAEEPSPKTKTR